MSVQFLRYRKMPFNSWAKVVPMRDIINNGLLPDMSTINDERMESTNCKVLYIIEPASAEINPFDSSNIVLQ